MLAVAACEPRTPPPAPLVCMPAGEARAGELLTVNVTLDSIGPRRTGEILVRVDPIDDAAFVVIRNPGPAAAVVGAQVNPIGRLQGCVASGASEVELVTAARHARKVWVRVATDRPVRVAVRDLGGAPLATPFELRPGSSGRTSWSAEPDGAP